MTRRMTVPAAALGILSLLGCGRTASLSGSDRREIVQDALSKALVERRIPDYGLLRDPTHIVISATLISPADLPTIPGIEFEMLGEQEIHARANATGSFTRLAFSKFEAIDASHVVVQLDNTWIMSDTSKAIPLSGGGLILQYSRRAGKWVGKETGQWISEILRAEHDAILRT